MNEATEEEVELLITDKTAGVILEPIQGEGGVWEAEVAWLSRVVKRAREVGAVVIFDEIQCGLFRTGTMWAHSKYPTEIQFVPSFYPRLVAHSDGPIDAPSALLDISVLTSSPWPSLSPTESPLEPSWFAMKSSKPSLSVRDLCCSLHQSLLVLNRSDDS